MYVFLYVLDKCPTCKREMKVKNSCDCKSKHKEYCYYCHLMKYHLKDESSLQKPPES